MVRKMASLIQQSMTLGCYISLKAITSGSDIRLSCITFQKKKIKS